MPARGFVPASYEPNAPVPITRIGFSPMDSMHETPANSWLTPWRPTTIPSAASGDALQGAAADCNSAGETHAWFDSRVAHHSLSEHSCKTP